MNAENIVSKAVFPKLLSHRPRLASKNNEVPSHPCSRKYRVSGW